MKPTPAVAVGTLRMELINSVFAPSIPFTV